MKFQYVETLHQHIPPPLSFIPIKSEESTGTSATIKVKISNSLMETVTAFEGIDLEKLHRNDGSIFWTRTKMVLKSTYQGATKMADTVLCLDAHKELKSEANEENCMYVPNPSDGSFIVTPSKRTPNDRGRQLQ